MESTTLKVGPTQLPITVEEVKAMLGLTSEQSQFDAFITSLIEAAVNFFENETNTKIMEQTWYGYLNDWPLAEDYIEIMYPPLKSITAIKYTNTGGTQVTWAATNYAVDVNIKPGRVYLGWLKDYPTAVLAPKTNAIEIEFICGYANTELVPFDIKNCLKQLVEFWFTNRGVDAGKIPSSIMASILKHEIYYL